MTKDERKLSDRQYKEGKLRKVCKHMHEVGITVNRLSLTACQEMSISKPTRQLLRQQLVVQAPSLNERALYQIINMQLSHSNENKKYCHQKLMLLTHTSNFLMLLLFFYHKHYRKIYNFIAADGKERLQDTLLV